MRQKTKWIILIILIICLMTGSYYMGIKHKRVVMTQDKGLAEDWNDDHEITGNVDVDKKQFLNNVVENRTDFPAGPVEGQVIYRTDEHKFYVWNGTDWVNYVIGEYTAGEGIDITARAISGEDASTVNKGIASFETDDFTVTEGAVSLKSKTSYWSINGNQFIGIDSGTAKDTVEVYRGIYAAGEGGIEPGVNGIFFIGNVNLPHGAVVTKVIAYGNVAATAETWRLMRHETDTVDTQSTMANANIGTMDNTIADATIDNLNYSYWIETSGLDTGDILYGVRITYTTDYD